LSCHKFHSPQHKHPRQPFIFSISRSSVKANTSTSISRKWWELFEKLGQIGTWNFLCYVLHKWLLRSINYISFFLNCLASIRLSLSMKSIHTRHNCVFSQLCLKIITSLAFHRRDIIIAYLSLQKLYSMLAAQSLFEVQAFTFSHLPLWMISSSQK
jgi:hypothetical protein